MAVKVVGAREAAAMAVATVEVARVEETVVAEKGEARVVVAVREAVTMVAVAHWAETLGPRPSAQIHRCQ